MDIKAFEPLLRDATIRAIDAVGEKLAGAEVTAENMVTKLLNRWNSLDTEEKEQVAGMIIATTATALTALVAMRGGKGKGAKKTVKKAVKKAVRKATR